MQRQDIAELTQSVERAINAECPTTTDLVATLTLNYVAAVIGMAKATVDITNTVQLLNSVICNAIRTRQGELDNAAGSPPTVH